MNRKIFPLIPTTSLDKHFGVVRHTIEMYIFFNKVQLTDRSFCGEEYGKRGGNMKKLQIVTTLYNANDSEVEYISNLKKIVDENPGWEIGYIVIDTSYKNDYESIADFHIPGTKLNAIKQGFKYFEGKYLKIHDPDDLLLFDEILKTIDLFQNHSVIITDWFELNNTKIKKRKTNKRLANYNTFYNIDLLKGIIANINENVFAGDDYYLAYLMLENENSIKKINTYPYVYRRNNPTSITNYSRTESEWKEYIKNNDDWFLGLNDLQYPFFLNIVFRKENCKKYSFYKKYKKNIKNKIWFFYCVFLKWRYKK